MLSNNKTYFLIFFIIMLIVSITPASAALIYQNNDNSMYKNSESDNAIDQDINRIQSGINDINGDLAYINTRSKDYNWRFWKWPAITRDILGEFNQMTSTSINMKETIDNLNKNIETSKNTPNSNNNDVYNTNATEDAYDMATVLSKRLNTTVTVEKVNANNIKAGDIIQYISQDKYPRYLEVKNVINENNAKQLRNDENVPLIFAGIYTTTISIHNNNYLRLNLNGADPDTTVKTGVIIQNETLTKNMQKVVDLNKRGNKDKTNGKNCFYAAIYIGGLAAIVIICGICSIAAFGTAMVIAGILGFIAAVLAIPAGWLYTKGENEVKEAEKQAKEAQLSLEDLNYVASNEEQTATIDIKFETFDGMPIVKKALNSIGVDWKKMPFWLLKKPDHGDLLPGPGIQFLYGPKEGYTGDDNFEFYTIQQGQVQKINVHIQVSPIPTLPIPEGV